MFSDEPYSIGDRLDLEVIPPGGTPVRCWAEVVWQAELPPGAGARFDIGLKFTDLAPGDLQRLSSVLGPPR